MDADFEGLPIIDATDELAPTIPVHVEERQPVGGLAAPPAAPRRRWYRRNLKGNTKTALAPAARTEVIAAATGRTTPQPEDWREQLGQGERGKAIGALTRSSHTHNSDSGFGAAMRPWWDR